MDAVIALRSASDEDEELLFQAYASTRADEMAALNWPIAEQTAFLKLQYGAQCQHYLTHYPSARHQIVQYDELAIGRLVLDRTAGEILLIDITLLPGWRNQGIGAGLIRTLQAEAAATNRQVRLHVHCYSPAARLYRRLGFTRMADSGVYWEMVWQPGQDG